MTFIFICPLTSFENDTIHEDLQPYKITTDIEFAKEFVTKNKTDIFEQGAYPYCAIVEIKDEIMPQIDTISIYKFNKNNNIFYKISKIDETKLDPKLKII